MESGLWSHNGQEFMVFDITKGIESPRWNSIYTTWTSFYRII